MAPRPVFIHGSGGSTALWEAQESRFEGCIVLALPGHPAGSPLRSVGGKAEWVAHALGELPDPSVLVGHSLGGAVALQVALIAPELVEGLVLVASAARFNVRPGLEDAARTDVRRAAERLMRLGWPGIDEHSLEREVGFIVANGAESLALDYAAVTAVDLTPRLHEIQVPTLVVGGGADVLTPPDDQRRLAEGIPDAIRVEIPDVGHYLMKERPQTLDLVIAGFLARLETPRA